VRFWDASALVAWLVGEPASAALAGLLKDKRGAAIWWGTRVECASAILRREREGVLKSEVAADAWRRLLDFEEDGFQVAPLDAVRDRAVRILRVRSLRAADAFQLAAALEWCEDRPEGEGFVCLDARLRDAAAREGFEVLPAWKGVSGRA
jgi:hypothetical protein